ncbi:MAG: EamA family transporter [Planctomycetota bacterium]
MAYAWFGLVCVIWGSSFILMKKAAVVFGPLTIGAGRVLGGAIVLGVLLGATAGWRRRRRQEGLPPSGAIKFSTWSWRGFGALWVVVVLGFVYPFSMQPYLIGRLGQSGFIGMMVCLVPLLTIAASVVLLRVWPSWRQWIGVVVGFAAMPVLFGVGRELGVSGWEFVLAATVPLGYAVSNTWVKKTLSHWSPAALTASACALAAWVLVPAGLSREKMHIGEVDTATLIAAVGAVLVLGVMGTGVATVLFYRLVQERGPLFAGMVTYVVPVEALLLGAMDGEAVTRGQVVALAVILGCVALVQWPARKPGASGA